MLSGLVYAASARVSNRFELCASVAQATRKLHVTTTPLGTTIGRVLDTMASDGFRPMKETLFDVGAIRLAAQQRAGIMQKQREDVERWKDGSGSRVPMADIHSVLAGMG